MFQRTSPSDASGATPHRLLELDALRGIAALIVVLFHYTTHYDRVYGHSAPLCVQVPFGKYGVQLFFAISGFVILMSLERIERARDFLLGRVARLYPAYWAGLVLTFTVVTVFGLPQREVSAAAALVNLSMFQEFFRVPHVDGVYWTLTVELSFYALVLVLLSARMLGKVISLFIVLVALQTLAELGLQAMGWADAARFAGRPHLQFFALGVLAFKWSRGEVPLRAALALTGVCLAHELLVGSTTTVIVFGVVLGVAYALSTGAMRWLAWRPLTFLGFISYPLYLLHQNIGYLIILRLEATGWRPEAAVVAALAAALLLATVVTHLVEQPALRFYRRWRKRSHARASVPATE
ncbi:acyltransferase [Archangium minus]|uniref:Acyltransferase n=1 Tax=Archangium minus TaxID=83450 RepID=A0ABY9X4S9_9BACT|nr:acyltransferase [Archangium minus]